MTMADLERALEAVRESDQVDFAGPRDPDVIAAVEEALGLTLPPTYRRFLAELGTCGVGSYEFYGVIDENFRDANVHGGVGYTLDQRERYDFPEHLVIVGETGLGEFYVLDTSQRDVDGECPVAIWFAGASAEEHHAREVVASDFGSYFWDTIQEAFGPR